MNVKDKLDEMEGVCGSGNNEDNVMAIVTKIFISRWIIVSIESVF